MGKGGYGLTYQEVYEMENLTIEAKAIYTNRYHTDTVTIH